MSLFGGMPFPVQFFLAFIVVLGLIGIAAWLEIEFEPPKKDEAEIALRELSDARALIGAGR